MNQEVDQEANSHDIEDIYDVTIVRKHKYIHDNLESKVSLPLLPKYSFSEIKGKKLSSFNLRDGARFFRNKNDLPDYAVGPLIILLARFVDFKEIKYTEFQSHIYDALPSICFQFVYKSLVDSGFRLLDRFPLHDLEPKTRLLIEIPFLFFNKKESLDS